MNRRSILLGAGASAAVLMLPGQRARASSWPAREVMILVNTGPGSSVEQSSRIVAEDMAKKFGQPFIIKLTPGAGGALGPSNLKTSKPDGYTIGTITHGAALVQPNLMKVNYDPWSDFAYLGSMAEVRYGLAVPASSALKSIADLITEAGKRRVTVGIVNSVSAVGAHQLAKLTGVKFRWIKFNSTPEVVAQVAGSHVDAGISIDTGMRGMLEGGKLRLLAVLGERRWPGLEVSTLRELGYNAVSTSLLGLAAPAAMDDAIRTTIEDAMFAIVNDKEVQDKILRFGMEPRPMRGAAFRESLKASEAAIKEILRETGMSQ